MKSWTAKARTSPRRSSHMSPKSRGSGITRASVSLGVLLPSRSKLFPGPGALRDGRLIHEARECRDVLGCSKWRAILPHGELTLPTHPHLQSRLC